MTFEVPTASLVALLLVSARVFAWMMIAPPIATAGIASSVKTVLSVAIALAMVPSTQAHAPAAEVIPLCGSLLEQVLVGAALGFLTRLLFSAVEMAGNLLDFTSGFAMSTAYDPLSGSASSVYGRFYGLLCTTLIFATDAHLVIFAGFLHSFTAVPLDATMSLAKLQAAILQAVPEMFVDALQIAGPLLVVLFIADLAVGMLSRISPQLNAFTIAFPVKIGLTLVLVGLGLTLMPTTIASLATRANDIVGLVI